MKVALPLKSLPVGVYQDEQSSLYMDDLLCCVPRAATLDRPR